jgi:hypothetical protein
LKALLTGASGFIGSNLARGLLRQGFEVRALVRQAAAELSYKGVCIAAGGAQALRFVKEHKPQGILAVACNKELVEGVQSMAEIADQLKETPTIMVVPLLKDGCVDTEVDEVAVLRAIRLGSIRAESLA